MLQPQMHVELQAVANGFQDLPSKYALCPNPLHTRYSPHPASVASLYLLACGPSWKHSAQCLLLKGIEK